MSKVRLLPESLANKIAAGEVVERPASAVKELIENSLDAKAQNVKVIVRAGGKRLIQVLDNGEGLSPDDALLAFERHATSKIASAEDLTGITTLGFRGEALPSIAGVSRLIMETRTQDQPVGTSIEIAGTRILGVKEIVRPQGTSVLVRDLFFNVPARKKFLRTDNTELSHIVNVFTQYALAYPENSISLVSSGTELFNFQSVNQLKERLFQVFGSDLLKQLVELETEIPLVSNRTQTDKTFGQERIYLHAFISTPDVQKLNRNSLYFFVNQRMVRDKMLIHALLQAYRHILPSGAFPVALLFIEMPYSEVDVNVHPSKTEVRFRRQSLIHDFLQESIRKALMNTRFQTPFSVRPEESTTWQHNRFPTKKIESYSVEKLRVDPGFSQSQPFQKTSENFTNNLPELPLSSHSLKSPPLEDRLPFQSPNLPIPSPLCATSKLISRGEQQTSDIEDIKVFNSSEIQPLGQIEESFIVASDKGSLLIIDQHVAHERILFEKILSERQKGKLETQGLLLPLIIELTPQQQVILENISTELNSCGFEVEPFGHRTLAIKSVPTDLTTADLKELLGELLDGLEKETQQVSLERIKEKIAASIACHAAIKVNTHLEHSKMIWLIDELLKTKYPTTCPHGRPIILRYKKTEILKAFKRI